MKKAIAILMMVLIASLPLYSSPAFAEVIDARVYGADNIDNIVRENEQITVEAKAKIGRDSLISPEQAWFQNLITGTFAQFNSCEEYAPSEFRCTLTEDFNWKRRNEISYKVYLYSDDKPKEQFPTDPESKVDGTFYVDSYEPEITSFNIREENTNQDSVTIEFNINDKAYRGSTRCSGIDRLEVIDKSDLSTVLSTIPISIAGCAKEDSAEVSIAGKTGEIALCAKAYDRLGHSSDEFSSCDKVTLDKEPLVLNKNSVSLKDSKGNEITYYKNPIYNAAVSVNVSGTDINSITADLSPLNPSEGDSYKELAGSCEEKSLGVSVCSWTIDIGLDKAGEGSKTIAINAIDMAGNALTDSVGVILQYDDIAPEVLSLTTGSENEEGEILASTFSNKFTATILENGAGLDNDEVILYIGSDGKSASECRKDSNWICEWNNRFSFAGKGKFKIYINTDSKDKLGNNFKAKIEKDLVVDNSRIVINNIRIEQSHSADNAPLVSGKIKVGDFLNVYANLSEENGIKAALGNFTELNGEALEGTCRKNEGYFICSWTGIQITKQGDVSREIFFNFDDNAGNTVKDKLALTVFQSDFQEKDFYGLKISEQYIFPIPKEVLASLTTSSYREVIPFKLEFKKNCQSEIEVANIGLRGDGDCKSARVNLMKDANNDYNGFLEFLIDKANAGASYTKVEIGTKDQCNLQFNVRCGDTIYNKLETEKVSFVIPLINEDKTVMPQEKLDAKIKKAEKDAKGKYTKLINGLDKIVGYANNICRIKTFFSTIESALSTVGMIFGGLSDSKTADAVSGGGASATEFSITNIFKGMHKAYDKISDPLDKFCGFVQCSSYDEEGKGNPSKFIKWANGNLCDILKESLVDELNLPKYSSIYDITQQQSEDKSAVDAAKSRAKWVGIGDAYRQTPTLELAKKSLVFSSMCGCIPGIIYNLKKREQLDCWYGYCLKYLVPTGLPVDECNKQREYNNCVYQNGQWTVVLDMITAPLANIVKTLEHPIASTLEVTKKAAGSQCEKWPTCQGASSCTAKWAVCIYYSGLSVTESILEITNTLSSGSAWQWDQPDTDYCAILTKDQNEAAS